MTPSSDQERIALFGGTFDPPHMGHLEMAKRARIECNLDHVVLIPCRQSPHKSSPSCASGKDRFAMLELATQDLPWIDVSSIELDRPQPSYSWQTVASFSESNPGAELFWILGYDQWKTIDRWTRPDDLRRRLVFIVFSRAGHSGTAREGFKTRFVDFHHHASATAIRRGIAAGDDNALTLLHPAVAAYIARHGLYQS